RLRRRAEGFADFHGEGVTLAAWELDHINRYTGVSKLRSPSHAHKVCVAVQLDTPADIDRLHGELSAKGVPFYGPPENYVWNARCAYFTDPDDTLWELYAWLDGGPGDYHDEQP
ncbi:MAG: VOC family protein, partial [Mesorhizobium sp.]